MNLILAANNASVLFPLSFLPFTTRIHLPHVGVPPQLLMLLWHPVVLLQPGRQAWQSVTSGPAPSKALEL